MTREHPTLLPLTARLRRWTGAGAAGLLLMAALACSGSRPEVMRTRDRSDASVAAHPDAAAAARVDASGPNEQPETPGPCDQPDVPCRAACNLERSPLCPGTQRCVMGCESGSVAQYCREPDPSALALGESCFEQKASCREGGCMQEPSGAGGGRCTAFCVVDQDCPMDTHCVASSFSFWCMAGSHTFQQGLCRPISVAKQPP